MNKFIEPGISFADKIKNKNTNSQETIKQKQSNTTCSIETNNSIPINKKETLQINTNNDWVTEFKNEMCAMVTALQNANKLLNEKLDKSYVQIQKIIEQNTELINNKIDSVVANINERININSKNIDVILSSLMETNSE